jgi:hypothetical protein
MILDFQYRIIDGQKILYKFAPNSPEISYKIDDDGYVNFSLEQYSWQKVETINSGPIKVSSIFDGVI